MSAIKYVGRTTDFRGKTLWEIVGNLKNFGVGRIVVRSMFERYPEPSYMKILKVEAMPPTEGDRLVKVVVEKTFRGRTLPKPVVICSTSYKADYRLLPKNEETEYCKGASKVAEKILPRTIDLPPLLKEFISEETGNPNPTMKFHFKSGREKLSRLARDGEKPNVEVTMGLGTPLSKKLYENVNL
uniref:Putative mitochondrial ribosomal protein s34 n=1 Tax=Tabanus bromius TaxID=304241 RepID=A0A0K8TRT1_TABBR